MRAVGMNIEEEFRKLPALQKLFWRCAYAVLCAALATGFLIALVYTVVFFADLFDVGRLRLRVPVFGLLLPIIAFFAGWKQAELFPTFLAISHSNPSYPPTPNTVVLRLHWQSPQRPY
jgi:cytochrome bd-type quinol oxidase subunit 1